MLTDLSTLSTLFDIETENSKPTEAKDPGEGIPLCTYHYGVLYRHLNPCHLKCKTCNKPISDHTKSRPIPEPSAIQSFLSANTDFNDHISAQDRVCFTCYKSHLFIIKHLKGSVQSADADFTTLIDK